MLVSCVAYQKDSPRFCYFALELSAVVSKRIRRKAIV